MTEQNKNTENKKWYRRIPGFRSGKKWKMITASIVYLILFFSIFPADEEDTTEEQVQEEVAVAEEESVEEEEQKKAEQAKAEEEEKQRKENEAKEKEEQEAAEQEGAEEIYLQIMRESVGTYVDIQFDKTEKTYVMTPTDQGLIDEISMLPMGIGHEDWGVLVDGMASMSKSGKDLVGEGYTINLVNPLNHENVILWIMDGEIIYNVIDDL